MAQFYPEDVIQEVSNSNDIVDVISEYVELKRKGSSLMGLCPFHREKTPSFSVSPDKQLFHCFGCGAGGTVINFIMRIENLDFIEAVRLLAERARIDLPEGDYQGDEAQRYQQKQLIYAINVEAARFFHKNLSLPEGEVARKYLTSRRITPKTIVHFGLGFALNSWDSLKQYLISRGFQEKDILKAGLTVDNNKRGSYDRFRNRIIFPIIDVRGNVIGFGGRVMDNSLPKYLNSPETSVFNKSRNLYGLNFAKNEKGNSLIIVEGYMDVISLHQNGILNTVASLGTSLTREQANIIKRYCKEVIIAYDADAAGQAATLRGMDILADSGCKVKILTLSKGKDPDEFIKTRGVERFRNALREAKSLIEYKLELLKQQYDINNIEEKIEFVNQMAQVFSKVDNSVERDVYINKISQETGIASEAIFSEIKKHTYRNRRNNNKTIRMVKNEPVNVEKRLQNKTGGTNPIVTNKHSKIFLGSEQLLINSERMLLNLLCYDKSVFNKVKGIMKESDFTDTIHKKLAAMIYNLRNNEETVDPAKLVSRFNHDEIDTVTSILHMETNYDDNYKAAVELVNTINKQKKILKDIQECLKEGNVERLNTLLMEYSSK